MTAQISAYGRLVADPQTRRTGKGTNMAMARPAVALPCNAADNGEVTFWLGVIAFGKQADALAKHHKGDLVSVAGNMQINQWTGQDGGTQQGYQVIADSVLSARTVRPEVKQGNRVKLRMLCAVPMSNNRPRPGMKDSTRLRRMKMIFD